MMVPGGKPERKSWFWKVDKKSLQPLFNNFLRLFPVGNPCEF